MLFWRNILLRSNEKVDYDSDSSGGSELYKLDADLHNNSSFIRSKSARPYNKRLYPVSQKIDDSSNDLKSQERLAFSDLAILMN